MELLVTIAVIGVLSSFVIVASTGQIAKARDVQRQSDLNQYRIALENYATKNGGYPVKTTNGGPAWIFLCQFKLQTPISYMTSCPQDPIYSSDNTYWYAYQTENSPSLASNYLLSAHLEKGGYWYVCSNGKAGPIATYPVTADCGF